MSDECLITQETVVSFCIGCQAVMRKFTLAVKTDKEQGLLDMFLLIASEQSSWVSELAWILTRLSDSSFFDFG